MNTDLENSSTRRVGGITAMAPVVMVSGPFGSGMEALAEQLALRLGVACYDPHKLDTLAADLEAHDGAWQRLKLGVGSFFEYWLTHLHEKPGMSRSEHLMYLTEVIERVAREGGVIAGVCTHMILEGGQVFHIHVEADPGYCGRRLAEERGVTLDEAMAVFHHLEEERRLFLHDLFEDRFSESFTYDLLLDAEQMNLDDMVATSLEVMSRRGVLARAA